MSTEAPSIHERVAHRSPSRSSVAPGSLQSALHAATRSHHTNLNKTITTRLPLCLPPRTSDPAAYHIGMLMFGQIFLSFERAINNVLSEAPAVESTRARDLQILQTLRTERLPRSTVLEQDFDTLSRRLQRRNPLIVSFEATARDKAEANTAYIYQTITSKPYLALAYAWTMYLAIFNGGRWLHRQLASAGTAFWLEDLNQDENPAKVDIQALSFWSFETSPDDPEAESLKLEFKRRFEEASAMLETLERDEVVGEAIKLFELCLKTIDDLDEIMQEFNTSMWPQGTVDAQTRPALGVVNMVWRTLSSSLIDPVYTMINSRWTRSMKEEMKGAE